MDKTPEEIKRDELVAEITQLETKIESLSNVENTHKLNIETLEGEIATLESTKEQKLGELSAIETDLANAIESAGTQKKTALKEAGEATEQVTELQATKKRLEDEVGEINAAITVATKAQLVTEESLAKAQDAHKAFVAHADSEKARILGELKHLDETAKAQVVVIEQQTALQTTLDEQNSTKQGQLQQLDTDIESKTEALATVTTELQTLEDTHAERMKTTGEEFKTFLDETEKAKAVAAEELKKVEDELSAKQSQAVAWVAREEELNQREQFIKERYAKAGIAW